MFLYIYYIQKIYKENRMLYKMSKKRKFLFIRRYFILIMRNRKTKTQRFYQREKTKEDFFFLQTKRKF